MPSETVGAAFGITVDEALALPCLSGARLIAGRDGVGRRIRVVNIMEVPDIVRWMRGGEFLLTTAYPVRGDSLALGRLVPELENRGLAALGIRIGPYLGEPPAEMLEAADRLSFPVVEIPSDVTFNDILSEVLGTILNRQAVELKRSEGIHDRLTAVALAGGSQQELVDALAELIGLPAALRDRQGRELVSGGSPPRGQSPQAIHPIKAGGARQGDVVVWSGDHELLSHQQMAMEHAATIAAMAVAQERAVLSREQRHRTLLLMELVSSRPPDRVETVRRAAAMGWNLDVARAAVLVELVGPDGPMRVAEQPIEGQLIRIARQAAGGEPMVWGLEWALAMLVEPGSSLLRVCQSVRERLERAQSVIQVRMGCGRVYADVCDFYRSYQEAGDALTLGRELYNHGFVLRHDELGVYRMLYQLPYEELQRQVGEALGPLMHYDRTHKGSLVHTLECYLRHNRNGVTSAQELNIHYNTLRYRLEQIERLTGGIERYPTSRLQLEIAIHANRVLIARTRG